MEASHMRVAYADPPYLGCCRLYGHQHSGYPIKGCWDLVATHRDLVRWLSDEFPDGWALSLHSQSLKSMLNLCPSEDVRIGAWVKPFAAFKANVTPAYAWEAVIFRGGRRRGRDEWSGRDWVMALPPVFSGEAPPGTPLGMKPRAFCWWLIDLLGLRRDDELVDVFPGSGVVGRTWQEFRRQGDLRDAMGLSENIIVQRSEEPQSADAVDPSGGSEGKPTTRDV